MTDRQDEALLIRKINDKASQTFHNGYSTNTDFLDLHEQGLFLSHLKELPPVKYRLFGGYEESERKILVFFTEETDLEQLYYPIKLLQIVTSNHTEILSHRDYLGALMNLGIERYKLGDLFCSDEGAQVFCMDNMADFVYEQLILVKKTPVQINIKDFKRFKMTGQLFQPIKGTVSSLRVDSVLKLGFSMSRGTALELIKGGKAYINSRLSDKGSAAVGEGDVISLRGFGKLKIKAVGEITKKGRIFIEIDKYK